MRNDLLDAQAAVDWAVSNFPTFEQKLNDWMKDNLYAGVEKTEAHVENDIIAIFRREHFPLRFNVEFGAYINVLRSALDILAASLARRLCDGKVAMADVYFPIVNNADLFRSGKSFKGHKFIQALPNAERRIIESLEPYNGGNELLWSLHQLDIMRKHIRSLYVELVPANFSIKGRGVSAAIVPISMGFMDAYDKTIIGLIPKGEPEPEVNFTPRITIMEVECLPAHIPVITALNEFARLVAGIIKLFDKP